MRKLVLLSFAIVLLVACNESLTPQEESRHQHTIIDWVDFVKLDGIQYESIHSGVVADPDYIGELAGEVTYKVSENVTNPYYNIQDGDAAFWEAGTKVYEIRNVEGLIAVEDRHEINGFRIYASNAGADQYKWHYLDIDKTAINKVEIYERYGDSSRINTIIDEQNITEFFNMLDEGEIKRLFTPDTSQGDPRIFDMIFYHNHVLAFKYAMLFDGNNWYWHPRETSVVSDDIEKYFQIEHR